MIDTTTAKTFKLPRIALVGIFFFSFLFFLYFSFPYGVLKESLTSAINRSTNFNIRIGQLTSDFPIGVQARDVVISKRNGRKSFVIKSATVEVGILSLLLGRLRVDASLSDASNSELDLMTSFSLFGLLRGDYTPKRFTVDTKDYPIGAAFDFALSLIEFAPEYQQFFGSYLEKITFQGKLTASGDLSFDLSSPQSSSGDLALKLNSGSFTIDDPSLKIDQQIFSNFAIKLRISKGKVIIDDSTAIVSQDLDVKASGGLELKQQLGQSPMDVLVTYKLAGSIQKEIGSLLDMFGGSGGSGALTKLQLVGTLDQWRVVK